MPYVVKHKETAQILTAVLQNKYGLTYYGVVHWMEQSEAKEKYHGILQQLFISEEDQEKWILVEVKENDLKLFNVKLNNNPRKKLFMDETGKTIVKE